jgi:GT2 family glycosyltransferase
VLHARIAVLITSHNRRHQTLACLSSLLEQQADADQYKLRVVHVDADSNDATASAIEQKFPEVELVHSDSDTYWGGGMRQAGLVAGTDEFDFHLWLNDDVVMMRLVPVLLTMATLLDISFRDSTYPSAHTRSRTTGCGVDTRA